MASMRVRYLLSFRSVERLDLRDLSGNRRNIAEVGNGARTLVLREAPAKSFESNVCQALLR